jgi:sec-independent protein translocase protein TatA
VPTTPLKRIINKQKYNTIMLGTWEIILIVLVVLLIFGGKKIPELMRGLGKGIRSFKDGMNGKEDSTAAQVKEEEKKDDVK